MSIEAGLAAAPVRIVDTRLSAPDPQRGAVIALGNFDGFHLGHLHLLHKARDMAKGKPFAAMSCEPHPVQLFRPQLGRYRLATARQKAWRAAELGLSYLYQPRFDPNFAALAPETFFFENLVSDLGVAGLVVGEDFRFGAKQAGDIVLLQQLCNDAGIQLKILQKLGDYSSTAVRTAISRGDLATTCTFLGRPWHVEVTFETHQAQIAPCQILPPAGHYRLRKRGEDRIHNCRIDPDGRLYGLPDDQTGSSSWAVLP